MITKLLALSHVARTETPPRPGNVAYARTCVDTRARGGGSLRPAASDRYVPRLHRPLECKWRISPMTGALSAVWFDPANRAGQGSSSDLDAADARSRCGKSRQAARATRGGLRRQLRRIR